MALDNEVNKLLKELDRFIDPKADFIAAKPEIDPASKVLRDSYTRGEAKGTTIVDKFEDAATLYLGATKKHKKDSSDKTYYAHIMRQMLGDNLGAVYEAIKRDDLDEMLKLFKDALVSGHSLAELESFRDRVQFLKPDQKIAFSKEAVKIIGGDDYTKVLENPIGYLQALRQINAIKDAYTV